MFDAGHERDRGDRLLDPVPRLWFGCKLREKLRADAQLLQLQPCERPLHDPFATRLRVKLVLRLGSPQFLLRESVGPS